MDWRYTAPGDMTIINWHAWFMVDGGVVHFSEADGDRWENTPDDGCLGLKLIFAAESAPGHHYSTLYKDDWYYRAETDAGVVWGATSNAKDDCREGRHKSIVVRQGMHVPSEVWAPVLEEMTRVVS
jgi:hypothetical protein